ncbi:DUF2726 domain-containing protein [Wohlfahrtiimonas chitiniclastica]|uniref:DUF2726 domain-containing protein n=1 Tax=Wohlfahrtiimonas chitiniclastica TaxID=400946 RepID=UPI001BCAC82C|nr:DUF2726 domain-containing protein [Wohlfahrtiimonas chitiniclastica]MBS7833590.1 DUF2726 domain-containing protein [Wohlfahrtiimonas chitiniclastica]
MLNLFSQFSPSAIGAAIFFVLILVVAVLPKKRTPKKSKRIEPTVTEKVPQKKPQAKSDKTAREYPTFKDQQQVFTEKAKREAAVKVATFEKRGLMNIGETIAFERVQSILRYNKIPLHVYPQVPLMAFIEETTNADYVLQLQKGLRPDFVLTDFQYNVVAVIEINGNGHHDKFDDTKTMILNSVGIDVINVDTNGWNRSGSITYQNHVIQKIDEAMQMYLSQSS